MAENPLEIRCSRNASKLPNLVIIPFFNQYVPHCPEGPWRVNLSSAPVFFPTCNLALEIFRRRTRVMRFHLIFKLEIFRMSFSTGGLSVIYEADRRGDDRINQSLFVFWEEIEGNLWKGQVDDLIYSKLRIFPFLPNNWIPQRIGYKMKE
jgi:hypothetical protein